MNEQVFHQLYEYLIDHHVCLLIDPSGNYKPSYREQLKNEGFLIISLDFNTEINNPLIRAFETGSEGWYTTFFNLIKDRIKAENTVSKDQEDRIRKLLHSPSANRFTAFYEILEEIAQDNDRSFLLLNLTQVHCLENSKSSLSQDDIHLFLEAIENYSITDESIIYFLLEANDEKIFKSHSSIIRVLIKNKQNYDIAIKDKILDISDSNQNENLDNNNEEIHKNLRKRLKEIRENFSDLRIIQWIALFLEIIFIIPLIVRLFQKIFPNIRISQDFKKSKYFLPFLLFLLMIFFVVLFSDSSNQLMYCYEIDNENTLSLFYDNKQLQALDNTLKRSDDFNQCSKKKFVLFKNIKELKRVNTFILEFIYNHILEKNELSRKDKLTEFNQFDTIAISDNGNFFAGSATSGSDDTSTRRSHLILWDKIGKIQDSTEPQIEIKDLKFWQTCLISGGRSSIGLWDISQGILNATEKVNIQGIISIEKIEVSRYSDVNSAYFITLYNGLLKVWKLNSQCKLLNEEPIFEIKNQNNKILDVEFIKENQQYIDIVTFSEKGDIDVWRYNKNTNRLNLSPISRQRFIIGEAYLSELHTDFHRKEKYLSVAINLPNSEYEVQLWSFQENRNNYIFKQVGKKTYKKPIKKIEIDQQEDRLVVLDRETLYIQNIEHSNDDQLEIENFSQYSVNNYKDFEIFPLGKQILLAGDTVKILSQTSDKTKGVDYSPVRLEHGIDQIETRNLIYPNNNESGVSTILIKDQKGNLYYYDLSLKLFGQKEENIGNVDYSQDGLAILKTSFDGRISLLDPNRKLKKQNFQDQLDNAIFYPNDSSVIVTLSSSQNLINFIDLNSLNSIGNINTININKSFQFDFNDKGEYLGIVFDNEPYSNRRLAIWKIVKENNNITSPIRLSDEIEAKSFAFYSNNNDRYVFILDKDGKLNLNKINENQQELSLENIEIELKFLPDLDPKYELEKDWEKIMILPNNKVVLAKKSVISIFELSQTNSHQLNLSSLFEGNWQDVGDIGFVNKNKDEEIIIGDTQGEIYKISLYADNDIINKSCIWLDEYYGINEMPQICKK